jgi:hypothetical protein
MKRNNKQQESGRNLIESPIFPSVAKDRRLKEPRESFVKFMRRSPLRDLQLDLKREQILTAGRRASLVKQRPTENKQAEDDELSPEFTKELRRRIADRNDPVRYVIYSDRTDRGTWRLWLDVSRDMYGMSIDQATLFKRKPVAQAVAKANSSGRKHRLRVAKITTKNGKRKVLKFE